MSSERHEPTTLRSLLERWRDRHSADPVRILNEEPACVCCIQWWPCRDRKHAVEALAILGQSKHIDIGEGLVALVPDSGVTQPNHDTEPA